MKLKQISWLCGVLLFSAGKLAAQAETSIADQPNPSFPMAMVDRGQLLGTQPRVWMVTNGGALASKATDANVDAWLSVPGAGQVSSGVAAVSFGATDGWHQRVFFARASDRRLVRLELVNDTVTGAPVTLPNPLLVFPEFQSADVAAVSYSSAGVTRNSIAAISTQGRLCIWDGAVNGSLSVSCTSTGFADASTTDVGAATVNGHVMFIYRVPGGGVRRSVKLSGSNNFVHQQQALPPGTALTSFPLALSASQVIGSLDLTLTDSNGRAWLGRMRPQVTGVDAWHQLPALPEAIAATRGALGTATEWYTDRSGQHMRTRVYARSGSMRLFSIDSDVNGNFTTSSWTAEAMNDGQLWLSIGDVQTLSTGIAGSAPVRAYGVAGTVAWLYADTTFQEHASKSFRDHLRPFHSYSSTMLGNGNGNISSDVTGISHAGYAAGIFGAATGTAHVTTGNWQSVVSQTLNGGSGYSPGVAVPLFQNLITPTAAFGADVAVGDDALLHHVSTQAVISSFGDLNCSIEPARELVYHRASSASGLAQSTPSSLAFGVLDRAAVLSTGQGTASRTHVLYRSYEDPYLKHVVIENGITTEYDTNIEAGSPELVRDAAGDVYGYQYSAQYGYATLCKLWPLASYTDCGTLGEELLEQPAAATIPFGETGGAYRCNAQSGAQQCIDAPRAVTVVAHPTLPRSFYVAYQTVGNGRVGVRFTRNVDGDLYGWRPGVNVIGAALGTPDHFDPAISIDSEGTVAVSLSRVYRGNADPIITNVISTSFDDGLSFSYLNEGDSTVASALPFNCASKRFEVGSGREAVRFGGKAVHPLRKQFFGLVSYGSYALSRWSLLR